MHGVKSIWIIILFILFGLVFIGAGIYFLSDSFLKKIGDSVSDEKKSGQLIKSGKICGFVSLAVGALTVFCGIILFFLPAIFPYLSLFYVLAMIAGFLLIICSLRIK